MSALISIIVPVYNVSDYIEQCLNSLVNQTLKDIKIIVVDDWGTDDSIQKVEKIALNDKRIQIIHNDGNQGLAESRNIGLKYVDTPYVAFLDSDDWVDNDYYQNLYDAIIKNNADIAVSDVLYYRQGKTTHGWVSQWNFKQNKEIIDNIKDKQYNVYACACWNKLYKTHLFNNNDIKYPKGLKIEDVPVTTITTFLAEKLVIVKDAKLFYRQRDDSIMGMSSENRTSFDIFKIYDYTKQLLDKASHQISQIESCYYILDNFKIFNIYSWFSNTPDIYKDEFWKQMKEVFKNINIKNNPYITTESKNIYNLVVNDRRYIYSIYVKLFDLIPFFKLKKTNKMSIVYLLNKFPICKIKR